MHAPSLVDAKGLRTRVAVSPGGDDRAAPLRPYLKEIDGTPLLSADGERELARRVAGGDAEARDHLIRANLRLVVNIARGYLRRGLPLEDLIAEGNLGLIRAAEGFDAAVGVRFSTYASYWIKQSIRRGVMNQGRFVRLPAYTVALLAKWKRAATTLTERLGRAPSPEEVGRALRLSETKVRLALEALEAERLGAAPASPDWDSTADHPSPVGHGPSPEEAAMASDELAGIVEGLGHLDARQAAVVRLRFGLGTGVPLTLREVGERLGLTRERVRQLEKTALDALRAAATC